MRSTFARRAATLSHVELSAPTAFVVYASVAFLYFGVRLLPHFGRSFVGEDVDPEIFIWSFRWWPHAILSGSNPFVTHAIWAPDGINLAWTAVTPALAIAFSPLTLAFGPVAAYNVAAILIPALAAWCAFLLCRAVVRNTFAALLGGYLFGFSSYMLGQTLGHMHMTAVFLLPLLALVVLRWVRGELAPRRFVLYVALLVGAQIWLSTEVAFTATVALAVAIAIAAAVVPDTRARLLRALPLIAGAYVFALVLASPLLAYALLHFENASINPPSLYSADALNFVVPTGIVMASGRWATSLAAHFPASTAERGAYVGLPALAMLALYAVRWTRGVAFLVAVIAASAVAALGTALHVGGHRVVALPWASAWRLPGMNNVLPVRLAAFTLLGLAVAAALFAADSRWPLRLRVALAALTIVSFLPNPGLGWRRTPERVAFFSDRLYKDALPPRPNLIVLPYGSNGDSMLWQAESGFGFRMAGGYVRPHPPPSFTSYPAVVALDEDEVPPGGARDLRELARAKRVDAIVVDARVEAKWKALLAPFGRPRRVGGAVVYVVR